MRVCRLWWWRRAERLLLFLWGVRESEARERDPLPSDPLEREALDSDPARAGPAPIPIPAPPAAVPDAPAGRWGIPPPACEEEVVVLFLLPPRVQRPDVRRGTS